MKIVYRAGDITEAEIVKGMLLSNNIEAHVSGYYLQGGIGETSPLDLAKVHVTDEDYEKAKEIIREYEGKQPVEARAESEIEIEYSKSTITTKLLVTIVVVIVISILSYWTGF